MSMVMSETYGNIHIPAWVTDVDSFWRWFEAADLPEKLPVHFIRGEVWVDVSMEELFSHNQIKTALGIALGGIIAAEDLGMYVPDGMMLQTPAAELVTAPDAMFFSNRALRTKRVHFSAGRKEGAVATRVIGTPDLVVEIVSANSEDKDTEWLMSAYHDAEIPEYWLIDAREEGDLRFDIYRRGSREYLVARREAGWVRSTVLKRSFRLTRSKGKHGFPAYTLLTR